MRTNGWSMGSYKDRSTSFKTKMRSMRNKMLASVTALMLCTATMTTGAMGFGHGGGVHAGGGGGHPMAMA